MLSCDNGIVEENTNNTVNRNFAVSVKKLGIYSEHLSPSAAISTTDSLPVCALYRTQAPVKRKQSEDSPEHKRLQSPRLTPKRRPDFLTSFKRKFGSPQSNKIDKYIIKKGVELLDVNNSNSFCVNENAFESDGHTSSHPDVSEYVEKCKNHNSICPQVNFMKSETSSKKSVEDIVILFDEIGNGGKNAGSSESTNSTVVEKIHSYNRCKQDMNISNDELVNDGTSIVFVAGVGGKDTVGSASTENCIVFNVASDRIEGREMGSEETLQEHVIRSESLVENTKDSVIVEISSDDDDISIMKISSSDDDDISIMTEGRELGSEETRQPHVIHSESLVDNTNDSVIIEISDDDDGDRNTVITISDESVIESCIEERQSVGSLDVYDLDTEDSQDVIGVKDTNFTAIHSGQKHAKMSHHSMTCVFGTNSLSQENIYFTHAREAVPDSPGAQSDFARSSVLNLIHIDYPGLEPVVRSCSDASDINCPASNPVIVSSRAIEAKTVSSHDSEPVIVNHCTSNLAVGISPASKPETVSSCIEPAVLKSCDCKSLVVNNSSGDSECKSGIVSIPGREPVAVCCAGKNPIITTSSDVKSVDRSISGGELFVYNIQSRDVMSPGTEHEFLCNCREPLITDGEQLVAHSKNVLEPVVVKCCKKPEDADGLVNKLVIVDISNREPMVIDRPVTEPMSFNECGRKTVIVDKPEWEPMNVMALDEEPLVVNKLDKELVLPGNNKEESLDERTIKINVQSYSDSSGHYDKFTNRSTSVREREFKKEVNPDQLMKSYKTVMYKHHDSAATRMGLKWVSPCGLDPYSCTQRHNSTQYKPFEVCDARSQIMEALMCARRWSCAFHFCSSVTSERSFPSPSAVLHILDFILNTHNDDLIGYAVSVLKKIVDLHPPCAPHMLKYYTLILTNTLGEDTPLISSSGIVQDIICKLNDILPRDLQSGDLPSHSLDVHEDMLVTLSAPNNIVHDSLDCEEHLSFCTVERSEAGKNYGTLKHSEKLNRLFVVLEIIVELFEADMSVFLVKRSFNLQKALSHQSYKPLIVSVLWKTGTVQEIGHLNYICRCIIGLYARCFVHKIRFKQRNVITRLLSLVAEAVRSSECNNELMYPYFGERCKSLAREISQCMSGMNPEDMVEALTVMMPSFLTLHVTNFLLSSVVGYKTTPSLNTILELTSKCFLPCEVEAEKMSPETPATSYGKLNEKKRNINKRNEKGETILQHACRRNKLDELKVLLENTDIDVNAVDKFGWTALHEAVHNGAVDCVRELLEYKPPPGRSKTDMQMQSKDGSTPLIDAVQNNQLESCKLLLKYGGSSLLKDKNHEGMNALDAATSPDIKALLESVKADELIKGEAGWHHPLVPLLLPIMLSSYLDTYQTLHILHSLSNRMSYVCHDHTERKGRTKLKFDHTRFLRDYRSLMKLKGVIRSERSKRPDNEMIRKLLFVLW